MTTRLPLWRQLFSEQPRTLLANDDFTVTAFRYASGVEGLRVENARGYLVILPWLGQMIWDAEFDGHDLTMRNMFSEPKLGMLHKQMQLLSTQDCWRTAVRRRRIPTRCMVKWPARPWMKPGLNWRPTACAWRGATNT